MVLDCQVDKLVLSLRLDQAGPLGAHLNTEINKGQNFSSDTGDVNIRKESYD